MFLPLVALLSVLAPADSLPTLSVPVQTAPIPVGVPQAAQVAPAAPGPLTPGSWGLGFRAFGSAYDILIRRALTDRTSLGLQVSWFGLRNEDHFENSSKSEDLDPNPWYSYASGNGAWGDQANTRSNISVAVPFEALTNSAGPIRMSLALGPLFRYSLSDYESTSEGNSSSMDYLAPRDGYMFTEYRSFGGGLEGSMGVRWFVQPGLAIAADFAASALWIHGTATEDGEYTSNSAYRTHTHAEHETDDVLTSSNFVGFGLEAWF